MNHAPQPAARPIITGARYVEQITAKRSDRNARAAFQNLALTLAPPAALLFDFGAGTGIDARFYAERGRTVAAYDVDLQMCDFLAGHCRDLIETGRIRLERGSYRDFLVRHGPTAPGSVDLVTANFAPLNLIGDLRELFAAFYWLTAPRGQVLASVLSPYFIGDLKYGWWWRNSLRLWRDGRYSVPGTQTAVFRRSLADFAAQCAPYFTLQQAFQGLPPTGDPTMAGIDVRCGGGIAALRLATCRFSFLLFEKNDPSSLTHDLQLIETGSASQRCTSAYSA